MKTLRFIGMTIMMVMLVFNFTACSSDDDDKVSSPIVGTWVGGEDGYTDEPETLVFKSDSKGNWDEDSFTYTINSSKVIIDYGDDDPETWTFSVSGNTLKMTAEDGVKYTFAKK